MKKVIVLIVACFLQLSLSAQTTTYLWSNGATTPTINVNPSVTTKYYVTITQNGVEYYDSLVVTVNSNQNKATISPTAVTSVCLNNAMAAITYTTTGATGIGTATGLPEGVSASWTNNIISITGTPTASGTFNYSIPLTGGCGTVNATGTLTVTAPIVPSFTQVGPFVSGKSISALPTTSNNSISGTWSPAINNTATTTYTFTPAAEQCASTTTMTITINEPLQYTLTASDNSVCAGTTVTLSVSIPNNTSSVTDIDGNTYPTVQIGTQLWMQENLRTTKYSDGTAIPLVTDNAEWASNWNNGNPLQKPMMSWYDNDQATYTANKFGALYNWYAVSQSTNGNKNVCPTGWHVPSDDEWTVLTNYLGGGSVAGGKMKSTGTQYWRSPNQDATNESGFSGLPGGNRYVNGTFNAIGYSVTWWSSTEYDTYFAWYRFLLYYEGNVYRNYETKTNGYSVRCLSD